MRPLPRLSLVLAVLLSAGTGCRSRSTGPPPRPEKVAAARPDTRPGPAAQVPEDPQQREVPGPGITSPPDVAAYAAARPALEKHCFRCHTGAGQKAKSRTLKHLSFDGYPPTGHHAHEMGATFRRVLLGNKAKARGPTMPADDRGAVTGEEVEKILAWADAFDRTRADRGHHPAPRPPVSP
jgi:hypothetical protein